MIYSIYTQRIKLNLIPGREIQHIHVSQRDTQKNGIEAEIWNGGYEHKIFSGSYVYIQGTKPDRHAFSYDCEFTANSNIVRIPMEYQMTIVPGPVECELVINFNDATVGTANFILDVEPGALIDEPDISKSELGNLEAKAKEQIAQIENYVKIAEGFITEAERYLKISEDFLPKFDELLKKANDEFKRVDGYAAQTIAQVRQAEQYLDTAAYYYNETREYYNQAIDTTLEYSNEAKKYANTAYSYISVSKGWSKMSESWAIGNTGVRDGENTNNSKYWSLMAQSYSQGDTRKRDGEATDNAKYWYQVSKENADKTEEYMNVVETYTDIVIPKFEIDFNTMTLYQTNYTTDSQLQFSLDGNDVLYYELVA